MTRTHACESEMKQEALAYHESRAISFWLNFFFFCARYASWFPRWSKPMWLRLSRYIFVDHLRGGIQKNTRWLLGPEASDAERTALTDRVLDSFYMFIHDVGRAGGMTREQLEAQIDTVEGEANYHAIRKLRRGAIIATAHMGSFEVGAAAIRQLEDRVHVAFQHDNLVAFDAIRHRLHEKLDLIEAPVDEGWSVWLQVRDALMNDEVILLQADRTMPGQHGVAVPFCGGHLLMPLGPIKLAVMTGAPIVPVFAIRQADGRVRLVIESAIEVDPERDRPRGAEPTPAMLRLAAVIEKQVRAHPEQWLMLHAAWLEDQDGVNGAEPMGSPG